MKRILFLLSICASLFSCAGNPAFAQRLAKRQLPLQPAVVAVADSSPGTSYIQLNADRFDSSAYPRLAALFNAKGDAVSSFCYAPVIGKFVIAGASGKIWLYDGTTFTAKETFPFKAVGAAEYIKVVATSTKIFAAYKVDTVKIVYSTDGITWTPINTELTITDNFCVANNIVFAQDGNLPKTLTINNSLDTASIVCDINMGGIAYDATLHEYVVCNAGNGTMWVAEDTNLSIWNQTTYGGGEGTTEGLNAIINVSGLFIAGGNSGALITATDPKGVWTPRTSNTSGNIKSLTFKSGGNIVAGSTSNIISSPDGTTWTSRASFSNQPIYLLFGATPSIFLRIQTLDVGGTISKSTAGTSWSSVTNALTYRALPDNPFDGTNAWISTQ